MTTSYHDMIIKASTAPEYSGQNTEKWIGSGVYANVFDSDEPDCVIKIGKTEKEGYLNDGWLLWAVYCMNNPLKSWMPRIKCLRIDFNTGKYYAVMERLQEYHPGTGRDYKNKPYLICDEDELKYEYTQKCIHFHRKAIIETLIKISKFFNEKFLFIDAHPGNWMWRGTKIVLTDPFVISANFMFNLKNVFRYNELLRVMSLGNENIEILGQPEYPTEEQCRNY